TIPSARCAGAPSPTRSISTSPQVNCRRCVAATMPTRRAGSRSPKPWRWARSSTRTICTSSSSSSAGAEPVEPWRRTDRRLHRREGASVMRHLDNLILNTDSYKASHWLQYPPGTEATFFYVESRGGRYDRTLFFGLQAILKEYLARPLTAADI